MTEAEWLSCSDPVPMVKFLRGRMSDRKLRLFFVAVARLLLDRLPDELRGAVEVGERMADGLASEDERLHYVNKLHAVVTEYGQRTSRNWFIDTPPEDVSANSIALKAVGCWHTGSDLTNSPNWQMTLRGAAGCQPALLREVFGNTFRLMAISPDWRSNSAVALARQMYESRDFSAMPILADALQDAGCDNAEILDHCRSPGPHVRGCWVVDLVLGKE